MPILGRSHFHYKYNAQKDDHCSTSRSTNYSTVLIFAIHNNIIQTHTHTTTQNATKTTNVNEIEDFFFESDRVSTLNEIKLKLDAEEIIPDRF